MRRVGLVVVDMQPRYLADIPVEAQAGIIAGVKDVLRPCRRRQIPVALVEYAYSGRTIPAVYKPVMAVPRAQRKVITKPRCNAFSGTDLDICMHSWDVDTIIIAGVHANYCVRDTVASAISAGYRVATAPDLIADSPTLSIRNTWKWYERNTTFYAHSAELRAIEIG